MFFKCPYVPAVILLCNISTSSNDSLTITKLNQIKSKIHAAFCTELSNEFVHFILSFPQTSYHFIIHTVTIILLVSQNAPIVHPTVVC